MNKKGMLANIISGLITILIGISLVGTISQQIDNALNCNQTIIQNDSYYGKTDSFGGAGTEHFGGYDGTLVHKSFLSNLNVLPDNGKSVLNPDCTPVPEGSYIRYIATLLPICFILAILGIAISTVASSLRSSGVM